MVHSFSKHGVGGIILIVILMTLMSLNSSTIFLKKCSVTQIQQSTSSQVQQSTSELPVADGNIESSGKEQSQLQQSTSELPVAVVHVGPHKTGSTTLQQFLVSKENILRTDNYQMFWSGNRKRTSFLAHCFVDKEEPEWYGCSEEVTRQSPLTREHVLAIFRAVLDGALDNGQNIIMSSEEFDRLSFDVAAFRSYLVPGFRVHIVISYRRFYDFIISFYNQMLSHRNIHGDRFQTISFEEWVVNSDNDVIEEVSQMHTYGVYKRFAEYEDFNISILNLHNSSNDQSTLENFFCNHVDNAVNTCEHAKSIGNTMNENGSTDLFFKIFFDSIPDHLPVKPRELIAHWEVIKSKFEGMEEIFFDSIPDHLPVKPRELIPHWEAIKSKFEGMEEHPLLCPSDETKQRLLELSIQFEKKMTPESWYNSDDGIKTLVEDFENKMNTTKFCVADTKKILETNEWQELKSSIIPIREG
eukprot:CAMPEP_0203661638 /NCGR_PEP_ID=MMETSP0088-20131115/59716_1 /ASSEMBLY_ACC=CAM_ASM_001087 /TAXON_ID=426623 /ORGANISM="Chaetoceros affinis, Strain CCMP159" /LENGTH=469 /DNA_ID=CAMNT_0050524325 /DNA_START=100 /DNA_END=1509 /DNA_ORIENTATION=+